MPFIPHDLGRQGEMTAVTYLLEKGYRILDRNYRYRRNEIDIVAADKQTLCFIEVKTRSSDTKGHPLEAVTPEKQKEIIKAASAYLATHPAPEPDCRFDVIAIIAHSLANGRIKKFELEHITNAFMA
ncbi:YraN family protein [Prosthecochloris sp. SCSIO W1101]|uniref:YraN family protein n=1 Tax=Prosthecochloris sp. SCSIO W1101 TaxID=2992242 RepID=UPI00223C9F96|nr:YraN family protein [Prosthecochloris sp. SCSIO W1101]UZJ41454.1 YraN family protein [Prosthecochloris sp. SCSIO W1101]